MPKKNTSYFSDFIKMVGFSCQAAAYLQTVLKTFAVGTLTQSREEMHNIEHQADETKHDIMKRLSREFVTPIDREDIIQLAADLDDVTDKIEDILIRIYIYNITQIHPAALQFAEVIERCCNALRDAMTEFQNFHRSTTLEQKIIEVNTLEEEGDALYIDSMRRLYQSSSSPREIFVWGELFDRLEDCCDACEHVADSLELVVMKNS